MKTASSSLASVNLRIARAVARRYNRTKKEGGCFATYLHVRGSELKIKDRNKDGGSFLWTFVREPQARAVSHFFFNPVGRGGGNSDDATFKAWLHEENLYHRDFQIRFLTPDEDKLRPRKKNKEKPNCNSLRGRSHG